MKMNIALASDNNYASYLHIVIDSIFRNNKDSNVVVYIIDSGIKTDKRDRIRACAQKYGQEVVFIAADTFIGTLQVDDTFNLSSYSRLFLTKLTGIDKIIYMDCDSLVCGNLSELWNINLDGKYFGGVLDVVNNYYKREIGLKDDDIYVNAGFLVMNLKELREKHWEKQVLKMIKQYHGSIPHHDQGIINALGKDKIMVIPPQFNVMDVYLFYTDDQLVKMINCREAYSRGEIIDARLNPIFIHYTAGFYGRPWNVRCNSPLKEKYLEAVKACGYDLKEFMIDKPGNRHLEIVKKIYNILPFGLYIRFLNLLSYLKQIERHRKLTTNEKI